MQEKYKSRLLEGWGLYLNGKFDLHVECFQLHHCRDDLVHFIRSPLFIRVLMIYSLTDDK